ncbi:pyridoxal-phosphate dependent enzyme [Streptomyces mobaraensis]|uniref:Pyridoxal-phosphate dependent enzyme n=1 Tax=Streptomyces mobaraensis TaxID=35621 RepID=A0A5N5WEG8_STRMB|nr:pyridoxal-phosphate dependent enzyme [Streptomyces mobaraensis]KAB7850135.1 pyridoxal-phosphate dependent enzyme [Streptomyces mobaraensis]
MGRNGTDEPRIDEGLAGTRYLHTDQIPLDQLTPYPGNAKRGDVEAIRASLRKNGQYRSLVVRHIENGPLIVLAGNHTMRALAAEGAEEARCEIVECDDATARRINLADNKLAELGDYDDRALLDLLDGLGKDYEGTGYSDEDLTRLLAPPASESALDAAAPDLAASGPSLADRFLVPPFDVLDARQGWWQERKRQWLSLGIRSEEGRERDDGKGGRALTFEGWARRDPEYYKKKSAIEQRTGRGLTAAEFEAEYYSPPNNALAGGTSVFDPVLCELAYRWFSAPGATVVDPFAGGSVRGLIAAFLGRPYIGNDLSQQQVEANRAQVEDLSCRGLFNASPPPPPASEKRQSYDSTDLTPVEEHGGHLVKRDDLFTVDGSAGGKVRSCLALASAPGVVGLVTAGSRQSPQVNIVATVARRLGLPCRVHVPKAKGPLTPELEAARAAGADIVEHTPGHNTVIIARAREDASARGWTEIPFGMECATAVEATAAQVANVPRDVQRIVIPVGSGMSLAGVLRGLRDHGLDHIPIVGVSVGANPEKRLDTYAPGWRSAVSLVHSELDYHQHASKTSLGNLALDPVYEAKCLPFLSPGDLLWVVGRRGSLPPHDASIATPIPKWSVGDSVQWVKDLPPESADLIFTCPPYYDLEPYSSDPRDLSSMDYDAFDEVYAQIISGAARALRNNRFAVFVTGDARDTKGELHDLRGATIRAATGSGLIYASGAVLLTPLGSVPKVAARTFSGTRTLSRVHQDILIFCKGNRSEAARACGDVDIHLPDHLASEFTKSVEALASTPEPPPSSSRQPLSPGGTSWDSPES